MSGEFASRPVAILVCDATVQGGFDAFDAVPGARVERELLFREIPSRETARLDHAALRETFAKQSIAVVELADLVDPLQHPSLARNPNHLFARDSAITFPTAPDLYLPARMREPLRRAETGVVGAALERLGHEALGPPPDDIFLEGGDVIPFERGGRRLLLVGFGPRTSESALAFLAATLVPEVVDEVVGLALGSSRMNLDGGLLPVAPDLFLVEPSSFDRVVVRDARGVREMPFATWLASLAVETIEVTLPESIDAQACNGVCLGDGRVVYYDLAPRVAGLLAERGIEPLLVPGRELVKGRGGPRCMTRPIYRAAAARAS